MPTTRVSPKHQITIPKPVFDEVKLEPGDILEAIAENGKIVLTPKRLADKIPAAKLTASEQKILSRARAKIEKINNDTLNSKGLNKKEIEAAAKAGLIDIDQAYFWTEEWQKDMRESERDVQEGRVVGPFDNVKDLMDSLNS